LYNFTAKKDIYLIKITKANIQTNYYIGITNNKKVTFCSAE